MAARPCICSAWADLIAGRSPIGVPPIHDEVCWCPGLSWGIYFAAYDNAKARWQTSPGQALAAPLHLLSAAEAGCLVRYHSVKLYLHHGMIRSPCLRSRGGSWIWRPTTLLLQRDATLQTGTVPLVS